MTPAITASSTVSGRLRPSTHNTFGGMYLSLPLRSPALTATAAFRVAMRIRLALISPPLRFHARSRTAARTPQGVGLADRPSGVRAPLICEQGAAPAPGVLSATGAAVRRPL